MDNTELKEFVLDESTTTAEEYIITASTDDLDNFDFSSDNEFDIEQNYELVSSLMTDEQDESMKELVKFQEAQNIIERDAKKFLNPEFVDKFKQEETNLINMIKKFDPNDDKVRSLTEEQKDKVYEIAQYLFNSFQKKLNDLNFHFPLTIDESKFIHNVFTNKLEYDQNEVFQLKDIKDNYLDKDFEKNGDTYDTYINVNDLIIFYHLLVKYKVKGITKEHYNFLEVLTKIGERIKLFNAYNVVVQRLSTDFQMWGGALSVEGELVGTALEPSGEVVKLNDITTETPLTVVNKNSGEVVK